MALDRPTLVAALREALATMTGSSTEVLGSLAAGTADALSDIDLRWSVGHDGAAACSVLPTLLGSVGAVESIRMDPDSVGARDRRLVFVRFREWPLWWRLDLEVAGEFESEWEPSTELSSEPDPGQSAVWTPWSPAESALMNVVAAAKAIARGRGDVDGLIERGLARIGAADPGGSPTVRMRALAAAAACDPGRRALADRVVRVVDAIDAAWTVRQATPPS